MPDKNGNPLPPLADEAFEYGETTKAEINLNTRCEHKNAVLNSQKREIRCECGSAWSGFGVEKLYEVFKKQSNGAQGLVDLAKWAEKQDFDLPPDLSKNHDKYIWDDKS